MTRHAIVDDELRQHAVVCAAVPQGAVVGAPLPQRAVVCATVPRRAVDGPAPRGVEAQRVLVSLPERTVGARPDALRGAAPDLWPAVYGGRSRNSQTF